MKLLSFSGEKCVPSAFHDICYPVWFDCEWLIFGSFGFSLLWIVGYCNCTWTASEDCSERCEIYQRLKKTAESGKSSFWISLFAPVKIPEDVGIKAKTKKETEEKNYQCKDYCTWCLPMALTHRSGWALWEMRAARRIKDSANPCVTNVWPAYAHHSVIW